MKTLTKTLLLAGAVAAGVVAMPSGANADSFHLSVNSGPAYRWNPEPVRYGPPPHARAHGHWKKHHRWDGRRAYRAGFRHGYRAAEHRDYRHGQRVAYGWR